MPKILAIFGATGQQGGSIAKYVLKDPDLSREFKVRAITRDTTRPEAEALKKWGAEIVEGDADEPEGLKQTLKGAHTVFGMTSTIYDIEMYDREFRQGKAMADAAVAVGAQYFIFSTLPNAKKTSEGKLQHVQHFDVKADVETYIRSLPIKSAFFAPGSFMQNFAQQLGPRPQGDGTFAIYNFTKPTTELPLIDIVDDSGKYVGAILAAPDKYEGKVFSASTQVSNFNEIVETMSKVTGKKVVYVQLPYDTWSGFLPPSMQKEMGEMFTWFQDYGYYGAGTKEQVEWTKAQARGKLTTLEEWLKKNPLKME